MEIPIISTREREVWTTTERKQINRVAKILITHGDALKLECGNPVCPDPRIRVAVDSTAASGAVLRCGCRDRVFSRAC